MNDTFLVDAGKKVQDVSILPTGVNGGFAIRLDENSTASMMYVGYASVGASESEPVWQIARVDQSGTPTNLVMKYAGGGAFNQIWDNRTSLTYA